MSTPGRAASRRADLRRRRRALGHDAARGAPLRALRASTPARVALLRPLRHLDARARRAPRRSGASGPAPRSSFLDSLRNQGHPVVELFDLTVDDVRTWLAARPPSIADDARVADRPARGAAGKAALDREDAAPPARDPTSLRGVVAGRLPRAHRARPARRRPLARGDAVRRGIARLEPRAHRRRRSRLARPRSRPIRWR